MRVVLYTHDMEPITVVNLPALAEKLLNEKGMVTLDVILPICMSILQAEQLPIKEYHKTVTLFAERLIRRGQEYMILVTKDEENALLLKCAFLPGQQAGLQEQKRIAFTHGFLDALARVGKI